MDVLTDPAPLNPHPGWAYPVMEFPADTLFGQLGGLTPPPAPAV